MLPFLFHIMNKRILSLTIVLMLLTLAFSGCIGGSEPETEDGDPVSLGESTDDWPTYYVATASNLPTCPGTNDENLGKLYYVEDVTEFQACTSSGWTTIDIGSSSGSSTISFNQPPRITAQIMALDDDLHNLTPNGWFYVAMAHWSAVDPEGETVTIGIDANRDGTIDLNLNTAEGASIVELPWNGSIQVSQIEIEGERFLHLYRIFDVIAEDASGATSTISVFSSALQNELLRDLYDSDDANDLGVLFPNIPQTDIDWLSPPATAPTPCGPNDGYIHHTYSAADAGDSLATDNDNLILLSWDCADTDLDWTLLTLDITVNGGTQTCPIATQATSGTDGCFISQTGDSDQHWEYDEHIFLYEFATDICNSTCVIDVEIMYDGQLLDSIKQVTVQ